MRSFKDNAGRTWDLAVNVATIKRIKGRIGVDLTALADGEPPLVQRLTGDMILQVDCIWAAIEPQARGAKITDEQWAESMGGEPMAAAIEAFWQEVVDFFRPSRPGLAALAGMTGAVAAARQNLAAELVDLVATPGALSTSSPESPESIPTPAPSAS
jgi:hypothetical protein